MNELLSSRLLQPDNLMENNLISWKALLRNTGRINLSIGLSETEFSVWKTPY
jgi:hypothetical protein